MWICYVVDVRNEEEYRSFVEKVRSQVGDDGLNMLINNSGISTGPTKKCTLDEVTQAVMVDHFVVNAAAPLLITKVTYERLFTTGISR